MRPLRATTATLLTPGLMVLLAGTAAQAQTVATWQGASNGSWFDANRWSTNPAVPDFDGTTSYRAVIDSTGSLYSISLLQNLRLASLRLDSTDATVNHTAGTMVLDGVADLVQGTWRLNGGTIQGGTIAFHGVANALRFSSSAENTLSGVTLAGNATFSDNSGQVKFRNGLTLAGGGLTIGGTIFNATFDGSQTLSGGTITMASAIGTSITLSPSSTLTVAAGAGFQGRGTISGGAGAGLTVDGNVLANAVGGSLALTVPTVTNNGLLEASNSSTLTVASAVTNNGTIRANGGTVLLNGGIVGTGPVIASNNGIVRFVGNVSSAALAALQTSTGGSAVLAGTMLNSGQTYAFGASAPNLGFDDARIAGGTFAFADGRTLTARGDLEFDGTSITGAARFQTTTGSAPLNVVLMNGASLANGARFVNDGYLTPTAQNVTFTGTLAFEGLGRLQMGYLGGSSQVVFAPGAQVQLAPARTFNFQPDSDVVVANTTLVNRGTISGAGSGALVKFLPGTFSNEGTIDLADGSTVHLGAVPTSGFAGTQWSNTGTIRARNGTVRLSGVFSHASIPGLDFAGSQVTLEQATINNAGNTLTFDTAISGWSMNQVAINGGTVSFPPSSSFTMASDNNNRLTFRGVRIEGTLDARRTSPAGTSWPLVFENGLDLAGTILAGSGSAAITANESQTWDGGTIDFRGSGTTTIIVRSPSGAPTPTLTIGPDMTIKGMRGSLGGSADARYINHGRIVSEFPGGLISVGSMSNYGTLEAIGGGNLGIGGVDNHGTIKVLNGGVLNIMGTASIPTRFLDGSTLIRTGGAINVMGLIDNTGRTLTLNSSTGYFAGRGGQIVGGTININTGGGFNLSNLTVGGSASQLGLGLDDLTLNGDLYQPIGGGKIRLGNMTLNGTATLEAVNGLLIGKFNDAAPVTLTGGIIALNPDGSTRVTVQTNPTSTVTLSPTTVIRGGGFNPGDNSTARVGQDYSTTIGYSTIVNKGRISADVPGRVLTIRPNIFRNEGVIEAVNGGRLELLTGTGLSWSNPTGTIRATSGGTVDLGGNFTTANLGTLDTHAGTLILSGPLNNTGATLTLSPTTSGSLTLSRSGRITGGTILAPATAPLRISETNGAILDGVTMIGDLRIGSQSAMAFLPTSSFDGTAYLEGDNSRLIFSGPSTLNSSHIVFSGTDGAERMLSSVVSLTLGADAVVRGGFGRIVTSTTAAIINNGLISADVSGQSIRIFQQQFTNNGTIEAINGGQIIFVPPGGFDGPTAPIANAGNLFAGVMSELSFEGPYRQLPTGVLEIALGMDEAIMSGWLEAEAVELGGTLNIRSLSGTALAEGDSFHILRTSSISGQFDRVNLPALASPMRWDLGTLYSDGVIAVVPSPSAVVLGLWCSVGLAARRKRS